MLDLKITTVIVESDRKSLNDSVSTLKKFNELSIVGKATTGEQGLALCRTFLPQLVVINIHLSDMSGFDFAQTLRNRNLESEIAFLAPNTKHAYESLNFKPLDYFVVPLEKELISEMISRFKQKMQKNELTRKMDLFAQQQQVSTKRVFYQNKGIIVLQLSEIIYCKAELTKTILKLRSGEDILVKTSKNATLEVINDRNFINASRSYCINKNYLRKIDKKNSKCILYHKGQSWEVPVSKTAIGILEKLNTQAIF